ncbi:hypothetical protein J6590_005775 [Homalodisca vitripennis]|nr:hypothetical protein J6590_005775 [Homalodisca vitripennis]
MKGCNPSWIHRISPIAGSRLKDQVKANKMYIGRIKLGAPTPSSTAPPKSCFLESNFLSSDANFICISWNNINLSPPSAFVALTR